MIHDCMGDGQSQKWRDVQEVIFKEVIFKKSRTDLSFWNGIMGW